MGTTASTVFLLVTYDQGSLCALWRPVTVAGLSGYRITVSPPQGAPQTTDAAASANSINIPIALTNVPGYTISIAVLVNADPGPTSTPLGLITAAASVLAMVYDVLPAARLSMLWLAVNQSPVTGYVVVLSDGVGGQWTLTPSTPQAQFTQLLDPTKNYQATIRATGSNGVMQGPVTGPLAPITASTQLLSMIYDTAPAAKLSLTWQVVNSTLVTAYVIVLDEVGASGQWTNTSNEANTEFDQTLDLTHDYQVTIRATGNNGVVQGPATAPLTAITAPASILSVVYDTVPSALLTLVWDAVNQTPVTGYVAMLSEAGTRNVWIATTNTPGTQFVQPLDAAHDYQVTVRATGANGRVQGPASAPLTALTASVQMQSMAYNLLPSPALALTWQAANQAAVTGYVVVLREAGTGAQWTLTPATAQAQFNQTLDTAHDYWATVRATSALGVVQGPATAPLTAITAVPVLTELDYNPGNFLVNWTVLPNAAITGYDVTVASATASNTYPAGNTGQVALQITLDATQTYSVNACATGAAGVVKGPPGAVLAPLLSSPTNPTLVFNGTAFAASWTADSNPAVTGYVAQLLRNGAMADQQSPAAPPATFADTLDSGTVYASWVRSTGVSVKGPWTTRAPGPYRSVATLTFDALGRLTTIARANAATTNFTFDSFGNLESVRSTGAPIQQS